MKGDVPPKAYELHGEEYEVLNVNNGPDDNFFVTQVDQFEGFDWHPNYVPSREPLPTPIYVAPDSEGNGRLFFVELVQKRFIDGWISRTTMKLSDDRALASLPLDLVKSMCNDNVSPEVLATPTRRVRWMMRVKKADNEWTPTSWHVQTNIVLQQVGEDDGPPETAVPIIQTPSQRSTDGARSTPLPDALYEAGLLARMEVKVVETMTDPRLLRYRVEIHFNF